MPFLDVLVTQTEENFSTTVYIKPTNPGQCLNGRSECPQRYKDSTIAAYIRRVITQCSEWKEVHEEIKKKSRNVLLNNGFTAEEINKQIKKILNDIAAGKQTTRKRKKTSRFITRHTSQPRNPAISYSETVHHKQKEKMQQSHVVYKQARPRPT